MQFKEFILPLHLVEVPDFMVLICGQQLDRSAAMPAGCTWWSCVCASNTRVHPHETNGIKTSCLISQRRIDEPESLRSCKLLLLF